MRDYSLVVRRRVLSAPDTLGTRLAKLALQSKYSVQDVSAFTGATRMTVYNWYAGRGVTHAYRDRVERLIQLLKTQKAPRQQGVKNV